MVDFYSTEYKALYGKEPDDLEERRANVYSEVQKLQQEIGPLFPLLNEETVTELRKNHEWTYEYLSNHYGVSELNIDALYRFAKTSFAIGNYREVSNFLYWYRLLSHNDEHRFTSMWGKLAAEILRANWDNAHNDLFALREAIDTRPHVGHQTQLQQRAWLAHWSLFIFFNLQNGKATLIDFFMQEKLLNAICTAAPHLLRYLTVCVVLHRRRRNTMHDLATVLKDQRGCYNDPVTNFLAYTQLDFDFEHAHQTLQSCPKLLTNDFFLSYLADEFMEQARLLLFETYCRIHKCIDINTLARRLDVPAGEEEAQLVNYIHTARVEAKIDAKNNQIVVATNFPSVYQQVIDKTKSIAYRSQQITNHIEKKLSQKDSD